MMSDILENFSDQEIADCALYKSLINLLQEVKLVHGPEGVNSTLRRHNRIKNFLINFQKKYIIDLESKIDDNLRCSSES